MTHFPSRSRWLPALVLLSGLHALPADAATYCVATSTQLRSALAASAASAEDDVIQLVRGDYPLSTNLLATINGKLVLRGGYAGGCPLLGRSLDATLTRVYGAPAQDAVVSLRTRAGGLEIDGISFEDLGGVQVLDDGTSTSAQGQVWIRRSRFLGNSYGLNLVTRDKNVRVENNLFLDNRSLCCASETLNVGLAVRHTAQDSAPIGVDVLFNTLLGNPKGIVLQGGGPFTAAPRLQNNILRGGAGGYALKIDALQLAATNNVWGTVATEDGGSFTTNLVNVDADPQLDAAYVPQAGSPALNSGTDFVAGGVPPTDHDGGARTIGSKPDRGALESTISDIGVITVTSSTDSGPGTLRQAILDSNQTVNAEVIRFNLGDCPRVISLSTQLPAITSPLTIDGFSQPGASPNTEALGDDADRCVVLNADFDYGLRLRPDAGEQITVRGLVFYDFNVAAIDVDGAGSAVIEGNGFVETLFLYEGPDVAGDAIRITGAPGSRVGGEDEAQQNLILRAAGAGVRLVDGGERTVSNNLIGIAANGRSARPNGVGIRISGGIDDVIEKNWIGHNLAQGVLVEASPGGDAAGGVKIRSNYIGRAPQADPDPLVGFRAGNGGNGVRITSGVGHEIASNFVAYNDTDGLVVLGGRLARFNANRVYENAELGIDLSPDYVDEQDSDLDTANRGNRGQNFPVLESAIGSDGNGIVTGYLPSATGIYTIQLFASRECDDSGFGEGEALIGTASVQIAGTVIPAPGGGTIEVPTDGSTPFSAEVVSTFANFGLLGSSITATATRRNPGATLEDGATSEFSACIPYQTGPQVFADGFEP
jgi:hypothetical protein